MMSCFWAGCLELPEGMPQPGLGFVANLKLDLGHRRCASQPQPPKFNPATRRRLLGDGFLEAACLEWGCPAALLLRFD